MSRAITIVFSRNWEAMNALNPDGSRKWRYIVNKGSSRSSKTYSLIDCFDLYARTNHNKRLTVWRDTKKDCRETVLKDALKRFKAIGVYKVDQDFNKTESYFTYAKTDSTFEIQGTNEEDTVHGLTQDVAWFNEPYRISKDTFDQVDQRTADVIFIDYNPKEKHWVEDIMKDPRCLVIHSTFMDNPFCPPESRTKILSYQPVSRCGIVESKALTEAEARAYDLAGNPNDYSTKQIKELSRCLQNEYQNSASAYKWSVYGLGEKGERPNRIFHWERIPVSKYLEIDAPVYYGCDWGTVDPWGIVEAKYLDGNLYLREKNYLSENELRPTIPVTELARINQEGETNDEKNEAVGLVRYMFTKLGIPKDRPIICDTNRPIKGHALRKGGWQAIPAMKKKGSIIDGIDLLLGMNVFYTDDSPNIEMEQENYSRKVDTNGIVLEEPEDQDNHIAGDPCRYIAMYLQKIGIIRGA